jgi:hypothetical protein
LGLRFLPTFRPYGTVVECIRVFGQTLLKSSNTSLSVDKVLDIAKTITTIKVKLPLSGETMTKTMLLMAKHKSVAQLFDQNFWKNF